MPETQDTLRLLCGERRSSESDKAVQACNDWLRIGPGRTLTGLLALYTEKAPDSAQKHPITDSYQTLKKWSRLYGWAERAAEYDAGVVEAQKNARRREIMESGLALDYERVERLMRLAGFLEEQMYEQGAGGAYHNIWVPDVKSVGSGQYAYTVDIERFNAAIIEQFRGTLKDIAEETGGRKQNAAVEVTGKDGGPIATAAAVAVTIYMPDNGRDAAGDATGSITSQAESGQDGSAGGN